MPSLGTNGFRRGFPWFHLWDCALSHRNAFHFITRRIWVLKVWSWQLTKLASGSAKLTAREVVWSASLGVSSCVSFPSFLSCPSFPSYGAYCDAETGYWIGSPRKVGFVIDTRRVGLFTAGTLSSQLDFIRTCSAPSLSERISRTYTL